MQKRYAAIDLGSNSCRLTIADNNGKIIFKNNFATKLGEGLFASGKLSPDSFVRAENAFTSFRSELDKYEVSSNCVRAIATAACRMASNSGDLQTLIKEKTGINLEIIDEKEEAELNLIGGMKHVLDKSKYVVLYDLGGASTEITLATNSKNPQIIYTISIPWGARNATEAFEIDNKRIENHQKLQKEINAYVVDFVEKSKLKKYDDIAFVATSSTPLRLVALLNEEEHYNRDEADGKIIDCAKTDVLIEKQLARSTEDMVKDERIGENRAPIFAAACIIFQTIYRGLGARKITASLASAQDGIIQQFMERDNGKTD